MAQYPGQANFLAVVDDDTAEFARHIPDELRTRGLYLAHRRPLVGVPAVPGEDKPIKSFRIGPEKAWQFHRLEINPAHSWAAMIFDCDEPEDPNRGPTPFPAWEVINRDNGHRQLGYILDTPVHRAKSSRQHPQDYAAAVYAGLVALLGADPAYQGVLARNPCKPGPHCETLWYRSRAPYELAELADWVDLPPYRRHDQPHDTDPADLPLMDAYRIGYIGRNVYLFRWGLPNAFRLARRHETRWSQLEELVWQMLSDENVRRYAIRDFYAPLPHQEIGYISKSIVKYLDRQYDPGALAAVQSERGIASGKARRQRSLERDLSIHYAYHSLKFTQQEVAAMFGLTQPAVHYILKRIM